MPSTYKTPGVYIEEISTLPASIAQVETAIPAFVGFTKKAKKNGKNVENKPTRIKSLLEYESYFGTGPDAQVAVDLNADNSVKTASFDGKFCLYDSMRMFFSNGGGPCYIVSVGDYSATGESAISDALVAGLETLRKEDEPTLLLFPDAVKFLGKTKLGTLQKTALKQCNDLQDRFCIFDLLNADKDLSTEIDGETVDLAFRNNIGAQYLKYGAAYYPNLSTTLSFEFDYSDVQGNITKEGAGTSLLALSQDKVPVEHINKVVVDETAFEEISIGKKVGDKYNIDFSGTSLLNVVRFEDQDVYSAYKLIPEEYNDFSTAVLGEKQIKARAEYIHNMLDLFAKLTMTDDKDEVTDPGTEFDLKTLHANRISAVDSRFYDIVQTLYIYDQKYARKGAAAAGVYDKLGAVTMDGAEDNVIINGVNYDITGVKAAFDDADSIYGTGAGATAKDRVAEAAASCASAFNQLFEETSSLYKEFQAVIENRKENLELLLRETNPIYSNIVKAVLGEGIVLPPSGAVAGVYAATDNERGVWVAPANRSLNSVVGPKVNLTAEEQGGLNVDVTAGKSINAIRSFTGKGTLIWGARTLAGNSNEWRYIPVRRLFNMIEESTKKATEFVVFEPNDKNTWVRTRGMIENFLNQIWKAGGLAGAKAEHAYIVKVGLGETMTAQDILEGRMIVEIHLAAVRPAEFIILRFMHKLQES